MDAADDDLRLILRLPKSAEPMLDRICKERKLTRSALARLAIGMFQTCHDANREGLYLGLTTDRQALETVLILPL
jgi:hypothetical protein